MGPSRQLLPTTIPPLPPNVKERDEGFARIAEKVAMESLTKISCYFTPVISIHTLRTQLFLYTKYQEMMSMRGNSIKEEVEGDNMI